MNTEQYLEAAEQNLLFVTHRPPVVMERGEGVYLYDTEGSRYLDFIGGWAVTALGHSPAVLARAISEQAHRLINASPAFYNRPMIELASLLVEHSCMDRVWFGSTGAEANEGAVKLARKYGALKKNGAFEVITAWRSFHGRTLAMMSATGKEAWKGLFDAGLTGFVHVPYNDAAAVRSAITEKTVAVMLEPVLGEGGAVPAEDDYLRELRRICDEHGILLIFDEVQTGLGRTGSLFAYEHSGVEPDILTLGKGIGGGFPLSALLAKERFALFEAGDQGGTYAGQPLAMAAGLAVVREILDRDLAAHAREMGEYLVLRLKELQERFALKNIRGRGLLLAADLPGDDGKRVVEMALTRGLILNSPAPGTLRFIPPLVVERAHMDEMIGTLAEVLRELYG